MVRPGVYVSEAPLPRVAPNLSPSGTYGAFIGTAQRGPTIPTPINSWSDFVALFGGFSGGKSLPLALYQYFSNGGGPAYVARVIASDAVAAEMTFSPSAADRLRFTARTKGAWGNAVLVDISVHASPKTTFDIVIYETIRGADVVMERFLDLTMDPDAIRYVGKMVNSTTIGSNFVSVEDILGDGVVLPGTGTTDPVSLEDGSDGDVDTIVAADYVESFKKFDEVDAMLVINCPGVTGLSGLVEHVQKERGDSVVILDTEENIPPTEPTLSPGLIGSYGAVYYPWLYIADPSPDSPRGSITKVPPGASVAGLIIRTDSSRGVFKAPAGIGAVVSGAVANELRLTNAELDALADQNVNVIRPVPGSGIAAMGARMLSNDTAQYMSVRRTLNYVKKRAVRASRFALFEPNTPSLWEQCRVVNGAFLSDLWQIGGLAGRSPEEAYYVKCDEDLNTPQTISNGELHIEIGISPAFPAEFIIIRVGQFEADASVVVIEEG